MRQILGQRYDGVIICDRFSAYVKYHKDRAGGFLQLCWAHIIRDIKALKHHLAVESDQLFAMVMRRQIGAICRLWHAHKRGKILRAQLIAAAEPIIAEMRTFVEANQNNSCHDVAKFNRQLLKRWHSLFTLIYHEGVEPTNNLAERLMRPGYKRAKSAMVHAAIRDSCFALDC